MNSFSLRDDDNPSQAPAHSKRRRIAVSALLGILVVIGSMMLGMFVGYEYVYSDPSRASAEDMIIPECKDLDINTTADLEGGLATIIEWYPESAAELRANKNNIVQSIVSMATPPKESPLRNLRLVVGKRLFGGRRLVNSSQGSTSQDIDDEEDDATTDLVDAEIASPTNCTSAVAYVLTDIVSFLSGFVWRTRTPGKLQFGSALLDWLQKNYDAKALDSLAALAKKIALAEGAAAKAKALWEITRQAMQTGGGWLKFYVDWMVSTSHSNPWIVVKRCVKIAAHLSVWFRGGLSKFMGVVTFQILAAKKVIDSAEKAIQLCEDEARDSGAVE